MREDADTPDRLADGRSWPALSRSCRTDGTRSAITASVGVGSVPFPDRMGREAAASRPSDRALSELADEELAVRAKREADAFGTLYDRYVDRIYRFVRHRTTDPRDAEDLTSEIFFRALRAIGRYAPSAPFYAWIYRIARNAVIDHHRSKSRDVELAADIDPADGRPGLDPEGRVIAADRRQRLVQALAHLADDQQEVIVLRFIEGLTPEECGEILGRRPAAVRDLQFRALHSLRRFISPEELAP
jgi:RNA polymerase sigma-70 factor, ECF subfamily